MGAFVVRDARNRSPFWYAVYRDATGRRLKKSTKLTAKSKALEVARALDKASAEARRGTLTENRTRELLSEVLQNVSGEALRTFSVEAWFSHFVAQKQKSRARQTAARHALITREFINWLGPRAKVNIAVLTSKDIAGFRDYRQSLGLAPSTVNVDLETLSTAFGAALKQGHIAFNPCAPIEALRDKAQRKAVFTPCQVAALVKAATGEWKGLILTAFYIGARLNDCANLRWRNVDLVSEIKTIRFEQNKTGREIVAVIHLALEDYLLSLPTPKSDDAFLFPSLAQRPTSPLSNEFRELISRARIAQHIIRKRSKQGRNVHALSFHSLRHSFSSLLANAGVAEETRMALTGHTTRAVHQHYTHYDLERLRDAVAVLPRI
jgi:integrase